MSAVERHDLVPEPGSGASSATHLEVAPDVVEVRRNAGVAALVAVASCAVAIAWLGRAATTGALLDWVLAIVTGLVGVGWLAAFADARTPLLVADAQGARIRLGRSWIGLPWSAVESVRHAERTSWWRDGRIEVVARNPERLLNGLTPQAARQARWAQRLHGGPLALPLGLGTSLVGSTQHDLGDVLAAMAFVEPDVVVRPLGADDEQTVDDAVEAARPAFASRLEPLAGRFSTWRDEVSQRRRERAEARAEARAVQDALRAEEAERRALAEAEHRELEEAEAARLEAAAQAQALAGTQDADELDQAAPAPTPTPEPVRDVPAAARADVLRVVRDEDLVAEETVPASVLPDGVRAIATQGHAVEPLVIDEYEVAPATDPVVGPELRAARTRLGFTVDQLAERTRIRPHVIEALEVDDFAPCGGDFYARGHLRTLARVLGVDPAPLLADYDERYAHAPVEARKVFEAELATGSHGSIRGTRGGPNWSVLVAAVMAVVLAWSVVQLVLDQPADESRTPVLNGSGGPTGGVATAEPVTVKLSAPDSGAEVVVRDAAGKVVWSGSLAIGEKTTVEAVPPVRVQSSDGSVRVEVDGRKRGKVGSEGDRAQGTYAAD